MDSDNIELFGSSKTIDKMSYNVLNISTNSDSLFNHTGGNDHNNKLMDSHIVSRRDAHGGPATTASSKLHKLLLSMLRKIFKRYEHNGRVTFSGDRKMLNNSKNKSSAAWKDFGQGLSSEANSVEVVTKKTNSNSRNVTTDFIHVNVNVKTLINQHIQRSSIFKRGVFSYFLNLFGIESGAGKQQLVQSINQTTTTVILGVDTVVSSKLQKYKVHRTADNIRLAKDATRTTTKKCRHAGVVCYEVIGTKNM